MTHYPLKNSFYAEPPFVKLSGNALGLWARACSWSVHQGTDGHIPDYLIALLRQNLPEAAVEELVAEKVWERTAGGFRDRTWPADRKKEWNYYPLPSAFYAAAQFTGLSGDALALWLRSCAWGTHLKTDGATPTESLSLLLYNISAGAVEELLARGIWVRTATGVQDTTWPECAKRAVIEQGRANARDRKRRQRRRDAEAAAAHSIDDTAPATDSPASAAHRAELGTVTYLDARTRPRGTPAREVAAEAPSQRDLDVTDEVTAEVTSTAEPVVSQRQSRPLLDDIEIEQETKTTTSSLSKAPAAPREDVEALCTHLAKRVMDNGARASVTARWRDAARLLLDRDRRPLEEAHQLIAWATNDAFWRANILSMPTFRAQYDKLRLRAQQQPHPDRPAPRGASGSGPGRDMDREIADFLGLASPPSPRAGMASGREVLDAEVISEVVP